MHQSKLTASEFQAEIKRTKGGDTFAMTERDLQVYFVSELRKNGFLVWTTSAQKRAPSKGVPDVIVFDLMNKITQCFEIKGPKTPLSEEQDRAVRLGAVRIVRDKGTADRIVRREV